MSDSVLISKDEWFRAAGLVPDNYYGAFNALWSEYEQQTKMLLRMQESLIERPIVLKTMEDADVIEQRQQLNTAIELLEACSEDLFISGDDAELETRVDEFIKSVKHSGAHPRERSERTLFICYVF
jgi:hypothetical protein